MNDKKDTWTVTVQMTVFAGDMDKQNVIGNAEKQLPDLLDGTDFMSVNVIDATRDDEPKDRIAIEWCIEDVKGMEGYEDLTDDEAREVLRLVEQEQNAEIGVNWEVLAQWADRVKSDRDV